MYELHQVNKLYRQGSATIRAVDALDLTITDHEFLVIQGPSGSGKSTLLQLLSGLDRPTSGRLTFENNDMGAMGDGRLADLRLHTFGFVFQQFNLIPTLTAAENVEIALAPAGLSRGVRRARVAELLEAVGLADRSSHLPTQLSGGEQQRVAIARSLANGPRVLFADEPTGNLDTANGTAILEILAALWRDQGLTVIVVTHDPRVTAPATRVLTMADGRVVASSGSVATRDSGTTETRRPTLSRRRRVSTPSSAASATDRSAN